MPVLMLASGSPRRADLLRQIGVSFRPLSPPSLDERPLSGEAPEDYVTRLASEKARAGLASLDDADGAVVMGADTTVVLDERILGKPVSADDAVDTLLRLAGKRHQVLSAVSLVTARDQRTALATTEVRFIAFGRELARRYVATGEPMDKAGAYGIQGRGAVLVAAISGSYSNVVGLPLAQTRQLLEWAGVPYWQ